MSRRAVFSLSRETVDIAAAAVTWAMRAAEAEGDKRQIAIVRSEVLGVVRSEMILADATPAQSFEWLSVVLEGVRNTEVCAASGLPGSA